MVEVEEGGWKNESNREVLLPTQISHSMEKLCQAKAYCSGKCIVFRLHSCCVSEPCETIALLHHRDSLHLVPLGASCKASFLLSGKEGWTKHTVIQQRRNALWRQKAAWRYWERIRSVGLAKVNYHKVGLRMLDAVRFLPGVGPPLPDFYQSKG